METNNCVSVFSVHYCYLSLRVNFNNTFINEHNEKKLFLIFCQVKVFVYRFSAFLSIAEVLLIKLLQMMRNNNVTRSCIYCCNMSNHKYSAKNYI